MKKMVFILVFCASVLAHAEGSVQAGQGKSTVCAACHGPKGISTNPQWPDLAGQHEPYLLKQLLDFKKQTRNSVVMTPLVANLSEQDMRDLAAFYSDQPLNKGSTPKKYLSRGEQLYRGGDLTNTLPLALLATARKEPVMRKQVSQYSPGNNPCILCSNCKLSKITNAVMISTPSCATLVNA